MCWQGSKVAVAVREAHLACDGVEISDPTILQRHGTQPWTSQQADEPQLNPIYIVVARIFSIHREQTKSLWTAIVGLVGSDRAQNASAKAS